MMRRPAKFRGRPRMKLYYMRICTGIGCRNVRDPQTGQESPLMYQERQACLCLPSGSVHAAALHQTWAL
jgi:hypothetical protein